VATFRGFIKEIFSIISWGFSLFVAFNLFDKFKLELIDYISQKFIIDIIAFSFPFLTTLLISHLISKWLSPKFNFSKILFLDKAFGFIFGALRGTLIVVLLYLGFLYLIGKEKKLPNLLLEAHTYVYLKNTADVLSSFFIDEIEQKDKRIKKEDI
jgi:membrane protein required for colicin V production